MSTGARGLPQLGGRLLWAYRSLWALLAIAALAVLGRWVLDAGVQPLVLGIRLIKSAILIGVAAVLLWKRPRDPVAAILALAFLLWTITSSVDFTSSAILPMLLDRARFLLFALALLLFPDGKWRPRWTRDVALASGLVCALGMMEAAGVLPSRLFLPLAIGCVLAAIASLIRRFRASRSEIQQMQLKWVAFGLVSGVGLILSARAAAALAGPQILFEAVFQAGIVLVALGFLVHLLRYRLYDAEAAISRSAALAVLTVALVATFAGVEAIIEWAGQQFLGMGIGNVSAAMAAAVAAILLNPLHGRISDWAEQRFQRDLVQLKARVPELLDEVPASWSPRQVGEAVLPPICDAIHAEGAAIILDARRVAEAGLVAPTEEFALELPLRCHFGKLRGRLLIGPRLDACSYGRDDIEALRFLLPDLGRALVASLEEEAGRRRNRLFEQRVQSQLARLTARTEEVERRLSVLR